MDKDMRLINRDDITIPRERERLIGGMIYVPLADVEKGLDASRVIFDERDTATIVEALDRQVRKTPRDGCCPTCWAPVGGSAFCGSCGQALNVTREVVR